MKPLLKEAGDLNDHFEGHTPQGSKLDQCTMLADFVNTLQNIVDF